MAHTKVEPKDPVGTLQRGFLVALVKIDLFDCFPPSYAIRGVEVLKCECVEVAEVDDDGLRRASRSRDWIVRSCE